MYLRKGIFPSYPYLRISLFLGPVLGHPASCSSSYSSSFKSLRQSFEHGLPT